MASNSITLAQKTPLLLEGDDLPIIWVTDFDIDVVKEFTLALLKLESDQETKEIFLYITSYGGDGYSLLAMIEAIMACRKPVNTVGMGLCASAGSILLSCGTGTRWMAPNSFMHIHHARGMLVGDIPMQEQDVKHNKQLENKMLKLMTARSKMTVKELTKRLKDETREWQLTAKEAKKYGFVDKVGIPSFEKSVKVEYK